MFHSLSVVNYDTFLKWTRDTRGHILKRTHLETEKKDVWLPISGNTSSLKESSTPGTTSIHQ